jgi:hypothetical protein
MNIPLASKGTRRIPTLAKQSDCKNSAARVETRLWKLYGRVILVLIGSSIPEENGETGWSDWGLVRGFKCMCGKEFHQLQQVLNNARLRCDTHDKVLLQIL